VKLYVPALGRMIVFRILSACFRFYSNLIGALIWHASGNKFGGEETNATLTMKILIWQIFRGAFVPLPFGSYDRNKQEYHLHKFCDYILGDKFQLAQGLFFLCILFLYPLISLGVAIRVHGKHSVLLIYCMLLERYDLIARISDVVRNRNIQYEFEFPRFKSNFNHASLDTYTIDRCDDASETVRRIADKKSTAILAKRKGWRFPRTLDTQSFTSSPDLTIFAKPRSDGYGTHCEKMKAGDFDPKAFPQEHYFVQECLENSMEMSKMFPGAASTIRIWTAKSADGSVEIADAVVNTPKDGNCCSNTVQGNYVIAIDLASGKMGKGSVFEIRSKNQGFLPEPTLEQIPGAETSFFGKEVPHWEELEKFAINIHEYSKEYFPFVACDYILTQDGPVCLEQNLCSSMDVFENCFNRLTQGYINEVLMNHLKNPPKFKDGNSILQFLSLTT